MTLPSLNLKPLPEQQRALRRAGIQAGVLEVDYQPEPPFFADQHQRYSFARLALGRARDNNQVDEVLTLKFQRHLLTNDADLIPTMLSHPRFDFGPYPWSHFYGPRIVPDTLPLPEVRKLKALVAAASALDKLVSSRDAAEALRLLSPRIDCELTAYLAILESQGITVRVLHQLNGGAWPDDEVLAHPDRFLFGAAARLVRDLPASPS